MDALGLDDIIALVSALAVMIGALGAMIAKISRCLAALRGQQTKERSGITDRKVERVYSRVEEVERDIE